MPTIVCFHSSLWLLEALTPVCVSLALSPDSSLEYQLLVQLPEHLPIYKVYLAVNLDMYWSQSGDL